MTPKIKTAAPVGAGSGKSEPGEGPLASYNTKVAGVYAYRDWRHKLDRKSIPRAQLRAWLRRAELERLFAHRYGRFLPQDATGETCLRIALCHVARAGGDARKRMCGFILRWAPWIEIEGDLIEDVLAKPQRWTADELAAALNVKLFERMRLKLTTIGCVDFGREVREWLRRALAGYERRAKRKRTTKKKITIAQKAAEMGISRRTYYRRFGGGTKKCVSKKNAYADTKKCATRSQSQKSKAPRFKRARRSQKGT